MLAMVPSTVCGASATFIAVAALFVTPLVATATFCPANSVAAENVAVNGSVPPERLLSWKGNWKVVALVIAIVSTWIGLAVALGPTCWRTACVKEVAGEPVIAVTGPTSIMPFGG